MNAERYRLRHKKPRITKNQQARADLIKAGYEILEDCCGTGQVSESAKLNPTSNLYNALQRARLKYQYKNVTYTVGAGLRFASQGFHFFVGGKN